MAMIAPSLLSADFLRLDREAARFVDSGAGILHLDVMDGRFVPNMTFGWSLIGALRPLLPGVRFDTHLMVQEPLRLIDAFCKAGSDMLTVHVESWNDTGECLDAIAAHGVTPGISLKPDTPVEEIFPYLDRVGLVLVMTVEPGFGGQSLRHDCVEKIAAIKKEAARRGLDEPLVSVDGGINADTCAAVAKAGADILVAGSAVYGQADMTSAYKRLTELANSAQ